jgi:hypothetical protein
LKIKLSTPIKIITLIKVICIHDTHSLKINLVCDSCQFIVSDDFAKTQKKCIKLWNSKQDDLIYIEVKIQSKEPPKWVDNL